jgi:WD40 repeat protein
VRGKGNKTRFLPLHQGSVTYLAFLPDGTHLASASEDGTIHIWRRPTPAHGDISAGKTGGIIPRGPRWPVHRFGWRARPRYVRRKRDRTGLRRPSPRASVNRRCIQ